LHYSRHVACGDKVRFLINKIELHIGKSIVGTLIKC